MPNYLAQILTSQFEAALGMLEQCVRSCPEKHWEGLIAQGSFRWIVYHTLFFTDLYLTADENSFELGPLNLRGGDERLPVAAPGLSRSDSLDYLSICRQKAVETLARETPEVLEGPSGFPTKRFSRGELHLYNLRHVQHHTGQLSAYLRRVDETLREGDALRWIGSGRR